MCENTWINIEKTNKYPEENQLVWLLDYNRKFIWLGYYEYLPNKGWFFSVSNGLFYIENNRIIADCEIEDCEITHWHPVPNVNFDDLCDETILIRANNNSFIHSL
jgi:hypothetical protein